MMHIFTYSSVSLAVVLDFKTCSAITLCVFVFNLLLGFLKKSFKMFGNGLIHFPGKSWMREQIPFSPDQTDHSGHRPHSSSHHFMHNLVSSFFVSFVCLFF